MAKTISSFELTLNPRRPHQTLTEWLYEELRSAILEGRLGPATRLPASRDFARLHRLSRGTVVSVFERLQAEGYLSSRVGSGTWVNQRVAAGEPARAELLKPPAYIRRVISAYARPRALLGLSTSVNRPFRMRDLYASRLAAHSYARREISTLAARGRALPIWFYL